MGDREKRLEELGYPLDKTISPGAIYELVVIDGSTIYASGSVPFEGTTLISMGKVPTNVSLKEAESAAALCAANTLRSVRSKIGELAKIERVLRLTGYVNSAEGFTEQHIVINGASQLCIDVFGDAGKHARSAIGVFQLPFNASVEVDMILKLKT
jgi:enamine deaminase RidA (YjgF/YER057c/UK114 family)